MAKIYPEHLPQSVIDDPKRNSERKVYETLSQLGGKFIVFYSVPWQTQTEHAGVRDGESDFVIAHQDMGIIFLEVKGGNIIFDAAEGQWYTTGRIKIKDPVDQGRKSQYALLKKLQEIPGWDKNRHINIGHAVCFPSIVINDKTLKTDLSREIILDKSDLDSIQNAVQRLFVHLFGNNIELGSPGVERIHIVENLMARSFQLRMSLGVEFEYEDRKLIELTESQMMALSFLGDRKRVAISGCAGSGKTMMAIEKALQLHALGFNVLLTCFNAYLASDLRKKLVDYEITVLHFHDLAKEVIKEVGFRVRSSKDDNEFNDVILPEALLEAAENLGPTFDAIIVDEGQDFKDNYWIALSALLRPNGYLYIFFDNNQNIYDGSNNFMGLISDPPFSLNQNCRNTKAIHRAVANFHNDPQKLICQGPDGRPPELQSYESADELQHNIQRILSKLINEEKVRSEDIAILTPRSQEHSVLKADKRLGNFTLTYDQPNSANKIQISSIHRFKGLERRVIILAEIDQHYNYNADMVMYVGCSRARTQLYVLYDKQLSSNSNHPSST